MRINRDNKDESVYSNDPHISISDRTPCDGRTADIDRHSITEAIKWMQ